MLSVNLSQWEDNIKEWTDLSLASSQRTVEDRSKWRETISFLFQKSWPDGEKYSVFNFYFYVFDTAAYAVVS